jgi:imidazolonepropionase-like amidohydrolase
MRFLAGVFALLLMAGAAAAEPLVLRPARVWTGSGEAHADWAVVVADGRITAVGPSGSIVAPDGARDIALPNATVLPGLIDLHTHLLLREYAVESWDDQVLRDSEATRVIRAVSGARATLLSGFTTIRDLGTEGAGYADVALRRAAADGSMAGPRMFVTTRAIVARGSYAPRRTGFRPDMDLPQGAQEVSGVDEMVTAVREQIAYGADWIKIYADYRYGGGGQAHPAFSQEELNAAVATARDAGVRVAVHAGTDEGMRRATLAGVATIEHGNGGSTATFRLMARRGVVLVPTLTAYDTTRRPDADIAEAFRRALAAGVTIANGSDAGVFPHGQNARELELMVEHGMSPVAALRAATFTAATVLDQEGQLGVIAPGAVADVIAVEGDPTRDIHALRRVTLVVQRGAIVREP